MVKKLLACLLCLVLLLPATLAEETTLRVLANPLWMSMDIFDGLPIDAELNDALDILTEIASAFETQNDQIDLFIFPADECLYAVKQNGYYTPLNDSEVFMKRLGDLYPAVQNALTTANGDLIGWVMGGSVMGRLQWHVSLAEKAGVATPETFDELLDSGLALIAAGVLPENVAIISDFPFEKEPIMDLCMDQYIRASLLEGVKVDFTAPEFLALAERIRSELPDSDSKFVGAYPDSGFVNYPIGFDYVDAEMLPMVKVLPGKMGLIDLYPSIVVVNPYSANREAAVAFLEEHFAVASERLVLFDASMAQTENLASYAAMADSLFIAEASPVSYDETLRNIAGRYISGELDAESFVKECQAHIDAIYAENDDLVN